MKLKTKQSTQIFALRIRFPNTGIESRNNDSFQYSDFEILKYILTQNLGKEKEQWPRHGPAGPRKPHQLYLSRQGSCGSITGAQ